MRVKGIDVFSGAGGMSIGASWAGIETIVAFDTDIHAAKTYQINHPETLVICDDVRNIGDFGIYRPDGPFVVFGGPPCQGFSTSNQRTRNTANENNWLFQEFLRAVRQLNPDWVVFENVRGILETANATFLQHVIRGLEELGYVVNYGLLNAADYGVPQKRHRLFVIGARDGTKVELPQPQCTPYVTVGEAIEDLQLLPNGAKFDQLKYRCSAKSEFAKLMRGKNRTSSNHHVTRNAPHIIDRYKYIPQGGNWENIPDDLMGSYADKSRCHTGIYRRLKINEPSVVIGNYRKNMLIHPTEDRGLSVREAARLQSFPDSYQFSGSIGFQQQQVGNAVPPLLAKAVFESLGK
ncbi:DNA cytosine methyltransferase [Kiloniella laminariae]|uniref:DNA (cytosine-5-)-methyltransferase n=1 Tax=Kiloniella laminariae TaxID=454162 RepID=A0ABT4LH09_9PROT|nr:DNA cytosine methyltransferase [Kiloniella laminariae]MCZ4280390.1 DNA cytosine methyltransferase [Kiloniella laminariae]